MSPYERQIDPLDAVDVNFVLGVPGQATPTAEEALEPVLSAPLIAQRLPSPEAAATPSLDELLAELGIERPRSGLGYDPGLGYETAAERDTEVNALPEDSGNHAAALLPPATRLDRRVGLGLGAAALVLCLGSAVSIAAYSGADGPSAAQIARANGAATSQVLAQDLGVGFGAYAPGGLPVTLTNTTHEALAYNVSVEALDAAGHRVAADVIFVGPLAPGQSTVGTMFTNATGGLAAELGGAQFHIVEASAY